MLTKKHLANLAFNTGYALLFGAVVCILLISFGVLFDRLEWRPLQGFWVNQPVDFGAIFAIFIACITFAWRYAASYIVNESKSQSEQTRQELKAHIEMEQARVAGHIQREEEHEKFLDKAIQDLREDIRVLQRFVMGRN